MAKKDYEVLGLSEDADEKAVKRAYFRLVRQFSPEKDPERFQEIRDPAIPSTTRSRGWNSAPTTTFPSRSTWRN